jgi:hypothetical protein
MTQPEVAVPVQFDDEDPRSIDCNEPWVDQLAESALGPADFEQVAVRRPEDYEPDEAVPVFPGEIPTELESDLPQVEELLSRKEAEQFLDKLVPNFDWRRWGIPPFSRAFGKLAFSPFELTQWVRDRTGKS